MGWNGRNVYVAGEKLTVVSDYKYLGVIIDSNCTYKKQIEMVTNVVQLVKLISLLRQRHCISML